MNDICRYSQFKKQVFAMQIKEVSLTCILITTQVKMYTKSQSREYQSILINNETFCKRKDGPIPI